MITFKRRSKNFEDSKRTSQCEKNLATKGKVEEEQTSFEIANKIAEELEEKGCTMIYAHPE